MFSFPASQINKELFKNNKELESNALIIKLVMISALFFFLHMWSCFIAIPLRRTTFCYHFLKLSNRMVKELPFLLKLLTGSEGEKER